MIQCLFYTSAWNGKILFKWPSNVNYLIIKDQNPFFFTKIEHLWIDRELANHEEIKKFLLHDIQTFSPNKTVTEALMALLVERKC